jgi:hypothetical protein
MVPPARSLDSAVWTIWREPSKPSDSGTELARVALHDAAFLSSSSSSSSFFARNKFCIYNIYFFILFRLFEKQNRASLFYLSSVMFVCFAFYLF